jgi:hypothetical protein
MVEAESGNDFFSFVSRVVKIFKNKYAGFVWQG